MKNFKKVLSFCLMSIFVIAAAVTSIAIFTGKPNGDQAKDEITNQIDLNEWERLGIHYASAEEDTGAAVAPKEMKGGAVYVGKGNRVTIDAGVIENHEGYYGGAFYVAAGGELIITGGTIQLNGAMYGGAIYIEHGGYCEIHDGKIVNNSAENGPAIWIENAGDGSSSVTDALKFVGTTANAMLASNKYANFGSYVLNYYVDGKLIDYSEQKIATFRNDKSPLTYEECNGWFWDVALNNPIEEGDVLEYTEPEVQTLDGGYTRVINLYTASATPDAFNFTLTNNVYMTASSKTNQTTGKVVLPRMVDGYNVLSLSNNMFKAHKQIEEIYIPATITELPLACFAEMSALKNVNLHKALRLLNDSVFYNCDALTEVYFANDNTIIGSYVFQDCGALANVKLPANMTTIPTYMFLNCASLQNIEIPQNVTVIDTLAFMNTGLISVELPSNLSEIKGNAFRYCFKMENIEFPATLTTIGDAAFQSCDAFTEITISASVTSIGSEAFRYCKNLTVINYGCNATVAANTFLCSSKFTLNILPSVQNIPANFMKSNTQVAAVNFLHGDGDFLYNIGELAFYGCTSMTSLTLPKSMNLISGYAFQQCTGLTEITLTEGINGIKTNAFHGCSNVTTINFNISGFLDNANANGNALNGVGGNSLTVNIGSSAGYVPSGFFTAIMSKITQINIAEGVSQIYDSAFSGASIEEITLPSSIHTLGNSAFSKCNNLQRIYFNCETVSNINPTYGPFYNSCSSSGCKVVIGKSITKVPAYLFRAVTNLTEVEFENGSVLSEVGALAFHMTTITAVSLPSTVTTLGDYAFASTKITQLNLPEGLETIGQAAFYEASNLTKITIPSTVTNIGANAFNMCVKMTEVMICGNFTVPDNQAIFAGVGRDTDGCTMTFAEGVTSVPRFFCRNSSVEDTSGLVKVVLSSTVERIYGSAFQNCARLKTVEFVDDGAFDAIESYVFSNCTGLTSIIFPNTITKIYSYAFQDSGLSRVYLPGSVQRIGRNCFNTCSQIIFDIAAQNFTWQVIDADDNILEQGIRLDDPVVNAEEMKGVYADGYYIREDYESYIQPAISTFNFKTDLDSIGWDNIDFVTGTTWTEFCDSTYNTLGFFVDHSIAHYVIGFDDDVPFILYQETTGITTERYLVDPTAEIDIFSNYYLDKDSVNICEFELVDGETPYKFYALYGMTWSSWVESGYNQSGLFIDETYDQVRYYVGGTIFIIANDQSGTSVGLNDSIVSRSYYLYEALDEKSIALNCYTISSGYTGTVILYMPEYMNTWGEFVDSKYGISYFGYDIYIDTYTGEIKFFSGKDISIEKSICYEDEIITSDEGSYVLTFKT